MSRERGLAVLVLHITRKMEAEDPIDTISALRRRREALMSAWPYNTAQWQRWSGSKELIQKGCDVFGNPLDPNHPWFKP
jgi:hypothetical protein